MNFIGVFPLDIWRVVLHYVLTGFCKDAYKNQMRLDYCSSSPIGVFSSMTSRSDMASDTFGTPDISRLFMSDYLQRLSLIHPRLRKLLQSHTIRIKKSGYPRAINIRRLY
jgi:hypothetical protein